jgi:hypothetical protein
MGLSPSENRAGEPNSHPPRRQPESLVVSEYAPSCGGVRVLVDVQTIAVRLYDQLEVATALVVTDEHSDEFLSPPPLLARARPAQHGIRLASHGRMRLPCSNKTHSTLR